jgi:transcriptional regulator with XRE-family HTH domain
MSLADLRQAGGVSSATLSRIKNNPNFNPSPKTIGRIARALEVPVKQLIEANEEKLL